MTQATLNGASGGVQAGAVAPGDAERQYSELEKLLMRENVRSRDLPVENGVVMPKSMEAIYRLAQAYVTAGMVPDSLRGNDAQSTTARVAIAISAGSAVGLTHTHSVANIMVVNNRPSMWGDALVAVVRRSPECVEIVDEYNATTHTATCTAVRMKRLADGTFHRETRAAAFSMKDAERGGLMNKGPWKSNPARMCQNRARAFALRDLFADLLMGVGFVEEEQDIAAARLDEQRGGAGAAAQKAVDALGATPQQQQPTTPEEPPANTPPGGLGVPRRSSKSAPAEKPAPDPSPASDKQPASTTRGVLPASDIDAALGGNT